jgi:flagellar protein FliL
MGRGLNRRRPEQFAERPVMAKVTTAPSDLDGEEGQEAAKPKGGSFIGRVIGWPIAFVKGLSKKQMMIYGGALVLVIGLGVGAKIMFGSKGDTTEAPMMPKSVYHDIPEMVVNLSATNERPQYLRVKITLEVENVEIVNALKPVLPRVIDTFQVHLRELRAVDLEGSAGLFRLREELTRRVNHSIAPQKIRAVLFKEIVVQ